MEHFIRTDNVDSVDSALRCVRSLPTKRTQKHEEIIPETKQQPRAERLMGINNDHVKLVCVCVCGGGEGQQIVKTSVSGSQVSEESSFFAAIFPSPHQIQPSACQVSDILPRSRRREDSPSSPPSFRFSSTPKVEPIDRQTPLHFLLPTPAGDLPRL